MEPKVELEFKYGEVLYGIDEDGVLWKGLRDSDGVVWVQCCQWTERLRMALRWVQEEPIRK